MPPSELTLIDTWWDSDRPDTPDPDPDQAEGSSIDTISSLMALTSSHRKKTVKPKYQRQGLIWQGYDLPSGSVPAVLLEPQRCGPKAVSWSIIPLFHDPPVQLCRCSMMVVP